LRRRSGRRAAALLKRMHRQQLSLAMLRTRLSDDDAPDLVSQRQRIAQTREALRAAVTGSPAEPADSLSGRGRRRIPAQAGKA
jgi:hypothetical protein